MYVMTCKYNSLCIVITNLSKFDQIDSISKFQKFKIFFSAKFFVYLHFEKRPVRFIDKPTNQISDLLKIIK